jgi:hypothetical protein
MGADSPIGQRWELMRERLDERQRRAFAAAEAKVIGRGGVSQVAAATGVARNTIMAGMQELEGSSNEFVSGAPLAPAGSTRRSGGGRKAATHKDPSLVPDLLALVDPTSRGDPESPLRWTCKSLRVLADELKAGGHVISHVVVRRLRKDQGYSPRAFELPLPLVPHVPQSDQGVVAPRLLNQRAVDDGGGKVLVAQHHADDPLRVDAV